MSQDIPTLVITGPVGVGKSSVASAVSQLLGDRGGVHALVDMDYLRWCSVSPPDDPFNVRLGLRNLALVWANYARAGAERLIIVDIVERRDDVHDYATAVPGARIVVVRLCADLPTIHARLERREVGASLDWHRSRAAELVQQMERDQVEDLAIDTTGKTVLAIAAEVLQRTEEFGI